MSNLRAGFGSCEITPPVGIDLAGFLFRENPSESVLDPLFARALAAEARGERVLLVSIECLGLSRRLGEALRDRLARETWIPAQSIMLMCTHTHSGPATVKLFGCGEMDIGYLRGGFRDGVVGAAQAAVEALEPCHARWGQAEAEECHEYRRAQDRGPSDAALVDHTVRAVWLESLSGESLGCFWNFAAHPTILCTREISGDWVGDAARRIENASGGVAVYGQGCAGDVGPILEEDRHQCIQKTGKAIADVVLGLRKSAEELTVDSVAGSTTEVEVPFQRAPGPGWFAEYAREIRLDAEDLRPGYGRKYANAMAEWAAHWATETAPATLTVGLQAIRLGPLALIALPFEPLSGVGHAIREAATSETIVLGYANACHSYLAPATQYTSGGYEINEAYRFYDLPAPYESNAAESVVEAAVGLM